MITKQLTTILFSTCLFAQVYAAQTAKEEIPNPQIDYDKFVQVAKEVAPYREERRLSEDDFIAYAKDPNTIILDARSAEKFAELHIVGAKNLSFPDFTVATLQALIPNKETRILIYCNNNFVNAPKPFPTKMTEVALNISTFVALYSYGYKNIYELGPVLDPKHAKIVFEGSEL